MSDHQKMRALIVDDDSAVLRMLVRAMARRGFECDTAVDGKEALARVAADRFDAVITDLKMPKMHGHALATQLLALESRPTIVVYTGVVEPRIAKDLLARGVDDILFKPFDLNILAAKVKALIDRRPPRETGDDEPN